MFDNLSRPGVERNLDWLRARHGRRLQPSLADMRDTDAVEAAVRNAKAVFHLAAQVAVTSSLVDPLEDFAVNAQGTLTILEAIRRLAPETPLVFASTNKVYGALTDLRIERMRGSLRAGRSAAARARHRRDPPPRFLHALRLLQGSGRPVRAGLCPFLRPAHRRAAQELHLRPAPVRHRGPGLGRAFPDPRAARRADHDLRRRQAGARHPARQRRGGGLSRRAGEHRPRQRPAPSTSAAAPTNAVSLRVVLDEIAALHRPRRRSVSYAELAHRAISSISLPTRAA